MCNVGHQLLNKCTGKKDDPPAIPNLNKEALLRDFLEKSKLTQLMVLNFTTTWCKPCKEADDPYNKLAEESAYSGVRFAKVDVDCLMEIAENNFRVKMMPTFLLLKKKSVTCTAQEDDKKSRLIKLGKLEMEKLEEVVGFHGDKKLSDVRDKIKTHMNRIDY